MLKSDEDSDREIARTGTASRKRSGKKIIPLDIFPPAKTLKLPNFKKKNDKLKAKSSKISKETGKSAGNKGNDNEHVIPVWQKKPPRSKSFLVCHRVNIGRGLLVMVSLNFRAGLLTPSGFAIRHRLGPGGLV